MMRVALHCGFPHADHLVAALTHRQYRDLIEHVTREPVGSLSMARMFATILTNFVASKGVTWSEQQCLAAMGFAQPAEPPVPAASPAARDAIVNAAFAAMGGVGF